MLHFEITRAATAAVGALILSTSFLAAAFGPATVASTDTAPTAYAQVHEGLRANG